MVVAAALLLYAVVVRDHDDPGLSRIGSAAADVHLANTGLAGASDDARAERDRATGRADDAEAAARFVRGGGSESEGVSVFVGDDGAGAPAGGGGTPSTPGSRERSTPRRRGGTSRPDRKGTDGVGPFTPPPPKPVATSTPDATVEPPSNRGRGDNGLSVRDDDEDEGVVVPDEDVGVDPDAGGDADPDQDAPDDDDGRWNHRPADDDCPDPEVQEDDGHEPGDDAAPKAAEIQALDAAAGEPPPAS